MATAKHTRRTRPRLKKNSKEYFIWCDESDKSGKFFSNFYGGLLVKSEDLNEVFGKLKKLCRKLHLKDEIKWHKVSEHYVDKYKELMDGFFDLVKNGKIKVRIMFTQNACRATHLTKMRKRDSFFILYYQFIKQAFGFAHANHGNKEIFLRLYFDFLPDALEKRQIFKEHIKSLQSSRPFQLAGIKIRKQDIAEVNSKKHLLLQMIDVVLGAVCFRLNNKHKEMQDANKWKGNRTRARAKERLYKHINKKVREIRGGFNPGASTGIKSKEDYWLHHYRH